MLIAKVSVEIVPNPKKDSDDGLPPKSITVTSGGWEFAGKMYTRDIEFATELNKLIKTYNVRE